MLPQPPIVQAGPVASARPWWPLALGGQFVFVFTALALSGPGRIDIVDGQTRYEVARSLTEHGDSVIRDPLVWFRVHRGRDGLKHTPYRFPQSGLGAVAIRVADATGGQSESRRHFFFVLTSAVAGAVLAVTYSVLFRRLGLRPWPSLLWGAAGIFCTPSWYYSTSAFDDILGASAVVLALVVALLSRERRPLLGAAAAGLLLGWAVNCKEPLAVFGLPAVAALWRADLPRRRRLLPAVLVAGGLCLGMVAYKAYDDYKFPPGSEDPNAEYEQLYGAMWTANPAPALLGLTFSPSSGMFWYCPTFLLSLAGWTVWRRRFPGFCAAVGASSLLYVLFLSVLTFFKGEPCWGPRYLTPVLAVWWVFAPAALVRVRPFLAAVALGLGAVVQFLGLSVDPQRLLLEKAIPFNYYIYDPWLQFHPEASHLFQRPREIARILSAAEREPHYTPVHQPTYATRIPPAVPVALTSALGHVPSPLAPGPLAGDSAYLLTATGHGINQYRGAVRRYHVFGGFRPWWLSQRYLAPGERPVDLERTVLLLAGVGFGGLGLMLAGARACRRTPTR